MTHTKDNSGNTGSDGVRLIPTTRGGEREGGEANQVVNGDGKVNQFKERRGINGRT